MNDVRPDPQQVPARAELLLAAELGKDAPGRPIYARLEPDDDHDDGERMVRSEGTVRPSGSVCGNPLRGTRDTAPVVPIGAPLVARTDGPDARRWRLYRGAPNGAVIYDGWIEHHPANAELALTERRAAAAGSPAAALRRAVEKQPGHASAEAIPGAPRHQPAWTAVDPSTPTTHLAPP